MTLMPDTEMPDDGTESRWSTEEVTDADMAPEGAEHDCSGASSEEDTFEPVAYDES